MKAARTAVTVILLALMVFGWGGYVGGFTNSKAHYTELLDDARAMVEKELYVKAAGSYREALAISPTDEIWDEFLDASRKAYEEGSISYSEYKNNLRQTCEALKTNVSYWKELLTGLSENGSSKDAYDCAVAAKKSGVTDEEVLDLAAKIIYDFRFTGKSYSEVITSPKGISAVYDGVVWGMIDQAGDYIYSSEYVYLSPAGDDDTLVITDKWAHIIDKNNVAQSVIVGDIKSALAYSDDYLPIQNQNGTWSYIRCSDSETFGSYEAVSSFTGGLAAVKSGGTWELVNTDFDKTGISFEDVKIHANGQYINNGVIAAMRGGKYSLFDNEGVSICDKTADDIDVYMGGPIAFKENGSWGFMNTSGEVIIEPRFESARSFSNGLAAVKENELWGFVDIDGRMVIEPQFADVGYFDNAYGCFVFLGQWQKIELIYH